MIILLAVAALVLCTPIVAALLVSIASRREDAAHTLSGRAHGWIEVVARRLLRTPPGDAPRPQVTRVPRQRTHEHDQASRPFTGSQA